MARGNPKSHAARLLRLHLVVNTRAELNQLGEGSLLMAHIKPVSLAITVMPSVRITRKTVKEVTSPWVEELALHLPSVQRWTRYILR